MTDTPNLALPLVQPAQAQKHVTVNEALARLDGLAQLVLASVTDTVPPVTLTEGDAYGVPSGAVNAWVGHEGSVAVVIGGSWVFVPARRGWRAIILDTGDVAIFDGAGWRLGAASLRPGGASLSMRSVEMDVTLTAGASVVAPLAFPERAIAFGVTGRVVTAISGAATSWELGVDGDTGRYGTGLGLSVGSWVNGPATPLVMWAATPLVIGAVGGDFAGGVVRLAVHYADLTLPSAV